MEDFVSLANGLIALGGTVLAAVVYLVRRFKKRQRPKTPATRARVVSPAAYRLPDSEPTSDAWAGVTASGYGEEVMAAMKGRGITPAEYVAGRRN